MNIFYAGKLYLPRASVLDESSVTNDATDSSALPVYTTVPSVGSAVNTCSVDSAECFAHNTFIRLKSSV